MSRRPLLLLPLALIAAGAISGCGNKSAGLLSSHQADRLTAKIDAAEKAISSGDCATAQTQLDGALKNIDALPSSVDQRLVTNLRQWGNHLRTRIGTDCQGQTETIQPETPLPTTPTPQPEDEKKPTTPEKKPEPQTPQPQQPQTQPKQPTQTNPKPDPNQANPAKPKPPTPPTPPAPPRSDGGTPIEE
jgi:outer membrane biosynthesis protein TonB